MELTASRDLRITFFLNNGDKTIVDNHEGDFKALAKSAEKIGLKCGSKWNEYYLSFVEYRDELGVYCDVRIDDKDLQRGFTTLKELIALDKI